MKQKTIWLVIEQGAGITHKAFYLYAEALEFIRVLEIETDISCYELHEIEII